MFRFKGFYPLTYLQADSKYLCPHYAAFARSVRGLKPAGVTTTASLLQFGLNENERALESGVSRPFSIRSPTKRLSIGIGK